MTSVWIVSVGEINKRSCVVAVFDHEPTDSKVLAAVEDRHCYGDDWTKSGNRNGERYWYDLSDYLKVEKRDVIPRAETK